MWGGGGGEEVAVGRGGGGGGRKKDEWCEEAVKTVWDCVLELSAWVRRTRET